MDAIFTLQKHGFQFIETMFETEKNLEDKPKAPEICRSLTRHISYHYATNQEKECVIQDIKKGLIFNTDRIALDPDFSLEMAGNRYALWAMDVLKKSNAMMVITEYQGKDVGFNVLVDKGKYYDGMLGGLFPIYLKSGLGFANIHVALNSAYDAGAKRMISHVSSNNFQMFKLHMLYGLSIKRMTYNLVRHK